MDGDGVELNHVGDNEIELVRKLAVDSIVLLKNHDAILPLKSAGLKKVAILGGNAKAHILSGGGSAALKPSHFVTPYDGIVSRLGKDAEIAYSEGARCEIYFPYLLCDCHVDLFSSSAAFKSFPTLETEIITGDGQMGWIGKWYSTGEDGLTSVGEPVRTQLVDETRSFLGDCVVPGITSKYILVLEGKLRPRVKDTKFEYGLTVSGRAKARLYISHMSMALTSYQLFIDNKLIIDNWTTQAKGTAFFGHATVEEKGSYELKAGVSHDIRLEYSNVSAPVGDEGERVQSFMAAYELGGAEVVDEEELLLEAVRLAKEADIAILVIGNGADYQSEGFDRTTLALPGKTDELVKKVAEVNSKTIVVVQSVSTAEDARLLSTDTYCRDLQSQCHGLNPFKALYTHGTLAMRLAMPLRIFSSEESIRPASFLSRSPSALKTRQRSDISITRTVK